MSCKAAMIKKIIIVDPDLTVAEALCIIGEHAIRSVPVVDKDANYYGMFGLHSLMDDLLPTAARMEGGITNLSFLEGGAPGAAKRIRKLAPQAVRTIIQPVEDESILSPDLPMLEAIRRLSVYGSPLPVLDENKKFLGLVSEQSCLNELTNVLKDVEREEQEEANKGQ
jgi:CBS-domain-containing membrane protein